MHDQDLLSPTKPVRARQPDWITLDAVGLMFEAAGIPRTRTLLQRYCRGGRLVGAKDAGPTGDEWFVDPASVPRAIAELKMIHGAQPTPTEPDHASTVVLETEPQKQADEVSTTAHERAQLDSFVEINSYQTEPISVRPSPTEFDIFTHPYVLRLEERIEKLETRYEAQVRRTEEIQLDNTEKILELQRMVTVGQNKTLADYMLKAREWILGPRNQADAEPPASDSRVDPA